MLFQLDPDQQILSDAVRRFITKRYRPEVRNAAAYSDLGYSLDMWRDFAALGAIAALFKESAGGFGGTGADIANVFEEVGRGLVVEPFLPVLVAGCALAITGGHEQLIASTIQARTVPTFAFYEPQGRYQLTDVRTRAVQTADGWQITGYKSVVQHLATATHILLTARTAGGPCDLRGVTLFLVAQNADGLSKQAYGLIDGGRAGELRLDRVPAVCLGDEGAAHAVVERAVAHGIVALCWEVVGIMEEVKASTISYLRTRKQFGGPIGRFQALRHRLVDVAIEIEQARSAAILAAAALDEPLEEREKAVSAAKLTIGRIGTRIAEESIQMHGGMGMTWELPVSHYAKRLVMIGHQLGDEDYHLARYIALRSGFAGIDVAE